MDCVMSPLLTCFAPAPKAASVYLGTVALHLLYSFLKEEVAVLTLQQVGSVMNLILVSKILESNPYKVVLNELFHCGNLKQVYYIGKRNSILIPAFLIC